MAMRISATSISSRTAPPGFLDAQANLGPWQFEVNYHLIVGLDMLDRKQWEKPLLVHYLEALRACGVDAPDFEEAWEAYRRETAYGFFIFAIKKGAPHERRPLFHNGPTGGASLRASFRPLRPDRRRPSTGPNPGPWRTRRDRRIR